MNDASPRPSSARRAAFLAAAQTHRDSVTALSTFAPSLNPTDDHESPCVGVRELLVTELAALEQSLRSSSTARRDGAPDDAAFYVRRRRVDLVRRRISALRALPSAFRKLATMSADECSALLLDLGTSALASAMKSIRPSELPDALHRLGPEFGRQVLQRVVTGPAEWPNDLRRLVRGTYLAMPNDLPGHAVLSSIGQVVIAAVGSRLTEADRAALHAASACDLRSVDRPADSAWLPFADVLRAFVRERLSQSSQEAR